MKTELTKIEMQELGWEKVGRIYVKIEDDYICFTLILPNGNAPVGGDNYQVMRLA